MPDTDVFERGMRAWECSDRFKPTILLFTRYVGSGAASRLECRWHRECRSINLEILIADVR